MFSNISSRHILFSLILLLICSTLIVQYDLYHAPFNILQKTSYHHCFEWQSIDHQFSTTYTCVHPSQLSTVIWTYDATGIMKYIQWIITRKLATIKITRLNNNCQIIHENYFYSNSTNDKFIQLYIMSLSVNLTDQSTCIKTINQIANINAAHIQRIYFKRKSTRATIFFQHLDRMTYHNNFTFHTPTNSSLQQSIDPAVYTINNLSSLFFSDKWISIDAEDLIKSNLSECEKVLNNFLSLLRLNISTERLKHIIEYDSHQFIEDSIWWDQSEVAERVLTNSIPPRSLNFTYSKDFYYLNGDRSFTEYLYKNRQCYNQGIFSQMQWETISNRSSTDKPDRCSSKPFDCSFSDLYSFNDREMFYQQFNTNQYFNDKSIKCGFSIPSIFDKVRSRYGRNHTCQTIIFTSITNCYDPLPEIKGTILPSFCFVALLDTKTVEAYKKRYVSKLNVEWDLIDLGISATPFSVAAKSAETLKIVGGRMFPLAKWIIWLDGKAHMNDIGELLSQAKGPVIGAAHPDGGRTSASEVNPTIGRLRNREASNSQRLNNSIIDIRLQEEEYKRDGFYSRSDTLKLKMYDIAVFLYRNNHPCITRYLCGWHNEINYYSYRGQLSVYYSAVRLNLTTYLHILPHKFYATVVHKSVC